MSYMQKIFEDFKQKAEPLLEKLSELRNSTVFPILFHSQSHIAPWGVTEIYDFLKKLKEPLNENVDIILFSSGGNADAAFHIGMMLHRFSKGILSFIVPRYAASAATLITFAGNRIVMGLPSELGPIDPQIEISRGRFVSAKSLRETFDLILEKIIENPNLQKPIVEALIESSPLTELVDYQRLLEHSEELAIDLLRLRMIKNESKAKEIAEKFVKGFKYHGRTITIDDALAIGLNIEELPTEEWDIIWEFHKLWETIAITLAEEGSGILSLEIGNGVAFIPNKKAEKMEINESSLEIILSKLTQKEE